MYIYYGKNIRCASSIIGTMMMMIMIVLNMMNNHVKYQRTLYLSLFVLSSFGYLRPVTCQPSFSPPSSHPKSCHNAARTLCEYIRIPIRVLSALTRLMFQMVDAVVVSAAAACSAAAVVVVVQCGLPFPLPPFFVLRSASSSCAM